MSATQTYHIPVMLKECIEYLHIQPDGIYVDATYGGGGHARAILQKLSTKGKLFAFDQDKDAQQNLIPDERLIFIPHNYSYITQWLNYYNIFKVHGILADLGVSLHQFQTPQRGFSYRFNQPLDMRMNQHQKTTARDIINTYNQEQLSLIFYQYSNLKNAKKLAHLIIQYRFQKPIHTTADLIQALKPALPKNNDYPLLSRIFQAIRIEVNNEVQHLKNFLNQSYHLLEHHGRLVILTYHSIEDKIVKHFMIHGHTDQPIQPDILYGTKQHPFRILTKKPLIPTDEELKNNPHARSAKLRAAEKI